MLFANRWALFDKWRNAGLGQIFSLNEAISRRNPDGFQGESTKSQRKKMSRDGVSTFFKQGLAKGKPFFPTLVESFEKWLARYCSTNIIPDGFLKTISLQCENEKIYQNLQTEKLYVQAIIDYISGMTDRFAISLFNELLEY